jgi:hypothetical protein
MARGRQSFPADVRAFSASTTRPSHAAEMLMFGDGERVAEVPEVHWVSIAVVIARAYRFH